MWFTTLILGWLSVFSLVAGAPDNGANGCSHDPKCDLTITTVILTESTMTITSTLTTSHLDRIGHSHKLSHNNSYS